MGGGLLPLPSRLEGVVPQGREIGLFPFGRVSEVVRRRGEPLYPAIGPYPRSLRAPGVSRHGRGETTPREGATDSGSRKQPAFPVHAPVDGGLFPPAGKAGCGCPGETAGGDADRAKVQFFRLVPLASRLSRETRRQSPRGRDRGGLREGADTTPEPASGRPVPRGGQLALARQGVHVRPDVYTLTDRKSTRLNS